MAAGLPRRLYRSRTDKMLSGVSAGLGAYFDIDPVLVRLLWVIGAVFTGGLLALAYILLWIIVPQEAGGTTNAPPETSMGTAESTLAAGTDVAPAAGGATTARPSRDLLSPSEAEEAKRRRAMTAGAILLALGVLFLASNLGLFRWFNWGLYWPLLLVVLGALLIWNRSRSGA